LKSIRVASVTSTWGNKRKLRKLRSDDEFDALFQTTVLASANRSDAVSGTLVLRSVCRPDANKETDRNLKHPIATEAIHDCIGAVCRKESQAGHRTVLSNLKTSIVSNEGAGAMGLPLRFEFGTSKKHPANVAG
jgi:hypothetical protein